MGGYGVVILGGEEDVTLWGAGYAPGHITLVAYAIEHIRRWNVENHRMVIHANAGLEAYIRKDGTTHKAIRNGGRTTANKPMEAFEQFAALTKARDADEWEYKSFRTKLKTTHPQGYNVAEKLANQALRYAHHHCWKLEKLKDYEIFATNETADIMDMS